MPTPTIDPMTYEAAYRAVKQYEIDKEVFWLIIAGVVLFFMWIFRE